VIPFNQFCEAAGRIPYQYRHPNFLYALVKWLRPGSVVEVGTHLGMSAVWMARGLQENGLRSPSELLGGRLHCIDNFCWADQPNQERDWNANIDACGVRNWVSLLKGRSQDVAWPTKVDMAYIDGNHSYKVCKHDIAKARGLGASCIVLNDISTCAGVRLAAKELRMIDIFDTISVPFDAGLLVAVRREPLPEPTQGDFDPWDKG
jgi:predicted O-methyltransferase YrrM